jgi:predicted DNA-binding transcriptional regulator YafY
MTGFRHEVPPACPQRGAASERGFSYGDEGMSENSEAIVGRHARAIRILTCLQAGPAFNARELATRMNVSRRTIYRDLNLIRNAGIEVLFDAESSGYKVAHNGPYSLTPPAFGDRDLSKIALMAQFSLLQGFPDFASAVRESLARLLAHYPRQTRESVSRLLNSCAVELPRPQYHPGTLKVVETMMAAITRHRLVRVELNVTRRGEPTQVSTEIAPYRLIASLQDWWVIGRSSYHARTIRLPASAILVVESTEEEYRFPQGYRRRRSVGHPIKSIPEEELTETSASAL